jgi:hypothetical protein
MLSDIKFEVQRFCTELYQAYFMGTFFKKMAVNMNAE